MKWEESVDAALDRVGSALGYVAATLYFRVFLGVPWWIAFWAWRAARRVRTLSNWIPIAVIRLASYKPVARRLNGPIGRALLFAARGSGSVTGAAVRLEQWARRTVDSLGAQT